jgi:hypothetical protein
VAPISGHSSPGAAAYTTVPMGAASMVPLVEAPVRAILEESLPGFEG